MTDYEIRHAARILLLDEEQRVLFLAVEDTAPWHHNRPKLTRFWVTPGGGVDPGEDHAAAARRELFEETGITDATFGPCVWELRRLLHFPNRSLWNIERIYLAHVHRPRVTLANLLPHEVTLHPTFHWWTFDELLTTEEHFMPPALTTLLPPILAGDLPSEPIEINCTP